MSKVRSPVLTLSGRIGGFPPEEASERYLARLTVELDVLERAGHKDDDLSCVAKRAAQAAALAYNLWSTQIVSVTLESIEPKDAA